MEKVYKLLEYFEKASLSKLDVEMCGFKLSIEKDNCNVSIKDTKDIVLKSDCGESFKEALKSDDLDIKASESSKEDASDIKAPFAGTFYQAPSPEEPPFVKPGDTVKKGQIIGIIEAMKLMNEITAPEDGIICSIEVDNESLVEYDQVLVKFRES